jgi:hypothetical protein
MQVVDVWTGRHANALRTALRLTNESFAQTLGTATRTVAKWNAEPDLVPVTELQRTLDTALHRASDEAKARFASLVEGHASLADMSAAGLPRQTERSREASSAELRLSHDPDVGQVLSWLDDRAGWPVGQARKRVAAILAGIDFRQIQDRAHIRSRVSQREMAEALSSYYRDTDEGFGLYRAKSANSQALTSILTRKEWLDLSLPLGVGRDHLNLLWQERRPSATLDEVCVNAAAGRIAEALAADTRIVNTPLYRLLSIDASGHGLSGDVGMTDFISYALTMDLLENELVDALADGRPVWPGQTPLRDRYLRTGRAVVDIGERLCCGGVLALFAAARPPARGRTRGDYVLLIQERSGRVLNAARRLAVIPKSFHEPLSDFSDDAQVSSTLEREMEEELFGRAEVDSTSNLPRRADPLHLSRLSPPMRWLIDHAGQESSWRMESTGFGLNLVSGNFEIASLVLIEDETWWTEYGGYIEANWESDGLRRYSSLDREALAHLMQDASWSNEGLFAFLQGLRRLALIGGDRVNLPTIELEM